jgi:serine/threonine protein kinase
LFYLPDLKSLNVLVFQRGGGVDVKLADFGTCRITDFTMTLEVGTPRWTAPEVSGSDNNNYTHKADVYSFGKASFLLFFSLQRFPHFCFLTLCFLLFKGILMWELLIMQQPYSDFKGHNLALSRKIAEEGLRPLVPPGIQTHPFVILMKKCWDANPSVRPNFTDVLALLLQVPDLPDPLSTYIAGMGSSGASGGGRGGGTGGGGGAGGGTAEYLAQAQGGNQPSALLRRKSTIR